MFVKNFRQSQWFFEEKFLFDIPALPVDRSIRPCRLQVGYCFLYTAAIIAQFDTRPALPCFFHNQYYRLMQLQEKVYYLTYLLHQKEWKLKSRCFEETLNRYPTYCFQNHLYKKCLLILYQFVVHGRVLKQRLRQIRLLMMELWFDKRVIYPAIWLTGVCLYGS